MAGAVLGGKGVLSKGFGRNPQVYDKIGALAVFL
jgi:hypothetical protein